MEQEVKIETEKKFAVPTDDLVTRRQIMVLYTTYRISILFYRHPYSAYPIKRDILHEIHLYESGFKKPRQCLSKRCLKWQLQTVKILGRFSNIPTILERKYRHMLQRTVQMFHKVSLCNDTFVEQMLLYRNYFQTNSKPLPYDADNKIRGRPLRTLTYISRNALSKADFGFHISEPHQIQSSYLRKTNLENKEIFRTAREIKHCNKISFYNIKEGRKQIYV